MWNLLFLSFALTATAQTAAWNASTAATFVFGPPSTGDRFVFSLNAVEAAGDLFFHLETSERVSWAAVGIGSQMKDALIFAAYASENGTGVTISPRIATRHAEPSYAKDIKLEQLWPAELNNSNTVGVNNRLQADAVCRNCTSWLSGKGLLDLKSTSAPFIFALGPQKTMRSSSLAASLRRHEYYGRFDMNMTAATSPDKGAVPPPYGKNGGYILRDASIVLEMTSDGSRAPAAHALIMIFAFVFLFPLGSLLVSVLHKALWHGVVQILALLMIVTGFGVGIYLSTQYNKVCEAYLAVDFGLKTDSLILSVQEIRFRPPTHRPPDPDRNADPTRPRPPPPPHLETNQISDQILQDPQIPRSCSLPSRSHQRWAWFQLRGKFFLPRSVHCCYFDSGCVLLWGERTCLVVGWEEEGAETAAVGRRWVSASSIRASGAVPGRSCCAVEGLARSGLMGLVSSQRRVVLSLLKMKATWPCVDAELTHLSNRSDHALHRPEYNHTQHRQLSRISGQASPKKKRHDLKVAQCARPQTDSSVQSQANSSLPNKQLPKPYRVLECSEQPKHTQNPLLT